MQSHVDSGVKAHLQIVAAHAKLQEKTLHEKNEQQEKQIKTLSAQVHQLTTALRHFSSNSPIFFPPPVFTMTDFEQHKKDNDQWFSPPFYSHIRGYKFCISVFANGSAIGKGTHIAVYLHMMSGEYDDSLKWPFHGEVTVQLLNQRRNANHYERALIVAANYSLDKFKQCVTRVQGVHQTGTGWGFHTFITHETLGITYSAGKDCQYLVNDCLKFQVNKVVVLDKLSV